MATYNIEITDVEDKALAWVAYSVKDWITSITKEIARTAIDQLYEAEVTRMTADPDVTSIPADKTTVVMNADIKSSKERTDEADADKE